jgi:hypothetical protein
MDFVATLADEYRLETGKLPKTLNDIKPMYNSMIDAGRPRPDWTYSFEYVQSAGGRHLILIGRMPDGKSLRRSYPIDDHNPALVWEVHWKPADPSGREVLLDRDWNASHLLAQLIYNFHSHSGRWPRTIGDLKGQPNFPDFIGSSESRNLGFSITANGKSIKVDDRQTRMSRYYNVNGPRGGPRRNRVGTALIPETANR